MRFDQAELSAALDRIRDEVPPRHAHDRDCAYCERCGCCSEADQTDCGCVWCACLIEEKPCPTA